MNHITLSEIDAELSKYETWEPKAIMVSLRKGRDGQVADFNLVEIIAGIPRAKGERKRFLQDSNNRYYLPASLNKNDEEFRNKRVVPLFAGACLKSGTEIRNRGWDASQKKLTLKCVRGRTYTGQWSKKNADIRNIRQQNENSANRTIHPETGYEYKQEWFESNAHGRDII